MFRVITLVMGGQFGSEGKGSVCSWLSKHNNYDLIIRLSSPNSGHTFYHFGEKYIMKHLPSTWKSQDSPIYLPSGSVINMGILEHEIFLLRNQNYISPICLSPAATLIDQEDIGDKTNEKIGTTYQGVGKARAKRCERRARTALYTSLVDLEDIPKILENPNARILIESSQGFGLSLHYKFYPFCTSTNITPYQILQDSDIPFGKHNVNVWVVIRTYPIRIAGNSGPLKSEITWKDLRKALGNHIKDEYTSVTKKIRRVGEFDSEQVKEMLTICNPSKLVLTFVDYLFPGAEGKEKMSFLKVYLKEIESNINRNINNLGMGPGKIIGRPRD